MTHKYMLDKKASFRAAEETLKPHKTMDDTL